MVESVVADRIPAAQRPKAKAAVASAVHLVILPARLLTLIQPSVNRLVLAVDIDEFAEELIINFPVGRIRMKSISVFYQIRNFVKARVSKGDGGYKGRTPAVGLHRVLHLTNRAVKDIGEYLAP